MSKEIIYIDYDEALNIYGKMIDASDGGFEGVRDEGGIRATLDFVQNDLYYPTFADKLTYLMYRFCSGHFFNDGNKKAGLLLFLLVGGLFVQGGKTVEGDRVAAGLETVAAGIDGDGHGVLLAVRHLAGHEAAPDHPVELGGIAADALVHLVGGQARHWGRMASWASCAAVALLVFQVRL